MEKRTFLFSTLLIAMFLLILLCLICVPVFAGQPYDTESSQKITKAVESIEDVDKAIVLVYSKYAIVALKPNPLYFSNQKQQLIENVKKIVKSESNASEVFVSTDLDVFVKAEKVKKGLDNGQSKFSMKKDIKDLFKLYKERA